MPRNARIFLPGAFVGLILGMILWAAQSDANCGVVCLNHRLKGLPARVYALEARLAQQNQYIGWLEERTERVEGRIAKLEAWKACFAQLPLTRYGQELGPSGYVFELQGEEGPLVFPTTALDLSYKKDAVGAWFWVNSCNSDRITDKSKLLP